MRPPAHGRRGLRHFFAPTGPAWRSAFAHAGVSLARPSDRVVPELNVLDLSPLRSTALLEHCFKVLLTAC